MPLRFRPPPAVSRVDAFLTPETLQRILSITAPTEITVDEARLRARFPGAPRDANILPDSPGASAGPSTHWLTLAQSIGQHEPLGESDEYRLFPVGGPFSGEQVVNSGAVSAHEEATAEHRLEQRFDSHREGLKRSAPEEDFEPGKRPRHVSWMKRTDGSIRLLDTEDTPDLVHDLPRPVDRVERAHAYMPRPHNLIREAVTILLTQNPAQSYRLIAPLPSRREVHFHRPVEPVEVHYPVRSPSTSPTWSRSRNASQSINDEDEVGADRSVHLAPRLPAIKTFHEAAPTCWMGDRDPSEIDRPMSSYFPVTETVESPRAERSSSEPPYEYHDFFESTIPPSRQREVASEGNVEAESEKHDHTNSEEMPKLLCRSTWEEEVRFQRVERMQRGLPAGLMGLGISMS